MSDDFKKLDASNISILYVYLSEGRESYIEWFNEQKPERQEYILELMGNMIADLINIKAECSKNIDIFRISKNIKEISKPTAQVIPLRRKPKFTVVK